MSGKNQSTSSKPSSMQKEESIVKDNKMLQDEALQGYIEHSKSALDSNASKRRVLFFYANWCPTCKPTDQNLKANQGLIPEDVTVIRVNYNDSDTDQEERDLAKKYAVTYQHTFVQIDQDGNEVTKWNGGKIEELLKNII